jgi:Uma2 family endonuclease
LKEHSEMTTEVLETAAETLTRRRATLEEFRALPESMLHIEYINGEMVMAPTPTVAHQRASAKIFTALDKYVTQNGLGEVFYAPLDVILPSGDVVQPDIFYLTNEEAGRAVSAQRVRGAPSFLVEILSPGSIKHDRVTKRNLYERNGVREYWIVDLKAKSIAQLVFRRKHYALTELGEGDSIRGAVLAGFESNVGGLLGLK